MSQTVVMTTAMTTRRRPRRSPCFLRNPSSPLISSGDSLLSMTVSSATQTVRALSNLCRNVSLTQNHIQIRTIETAAIANVRPGISGFSAAAPETDSGMKIAPMVHIWVPLCRLLVEYSLYKHRRVSGSPPSSISHSCRRSCGCFSRLVRLPVLISVNFSR